MGRAVVSIVHPLTTQLLAKLKAEDLPSATRSQVPPLETQPVPDVSVQSRAHQR